MGDSEIFVGRVARFTRAVLMVSAMGVAGIAPAMAQDTAAQDTQNDSAQSAATGGEIIVTGSRLRQTDLVAAAPVTIMDAAEIDRTGAQSVGELLRELPVASPSTSESAGRGNDGSATVALRGLDAVNTLVLVNGRRMLSNNAGGTVDLNSVSFDAVERVEILQNGASAIYGTDAVAGVVNMIMRRDYDGIRVRAGMGISSRGDLPTQEVSALFGRKWSTGGFVLNAAYRHSGGNKISDRPVSLDPDWRAQGGRNFRDSAPLSTAFRGLDPADPNRALIIREGVTQATSLADFRDYIFPGTATPITSGNDGVNYFEYESSASKISQYNLYFSGHQDLNDSISAFVEASYNKRNSLGFFAPDYFIFSDQNIVSANNDYNPFGRDVAAARTLLEVTRTGVPRSKDVSSKLYRIVGGLQGRIGNSWNWELSGNYQKLDYYSYGGRGVQRARLRIAIGDSDICRATPGCVPMNLFGATGSVTDEMLDFVLVDRFTDIDSKLASFVGNISGTLLQLPAGDLNISIGGEYRAESFAQVQDDQPDKTTRTPPFLPATRKVSEVYGELGIPLLRDIPFIYRLDVEAAVRFSHYNGFGNTTNPQASVRWRPYEDLLIRGSWSSAFRAPNFTEANTTQSRSARPVNDPCASPSYASFPGCNGRQAEVNTSTPIITGGNPDLRPETAKSITAGFVFTPRFLPRFSLTVDFYKINKSDIIGIADPAYIALQNAQGTGYLGAVLRSPVNNSITDIYSLRENLLKLKVRGIDIGAEYTTPEASWGSLNIRADATYLDSYTQSPAPGTPPVERAGTYTTAIGTLAKWRASGRATWTLNNISLTYGMRYVGGVENQASLLVNGQYLRAGSYLQHDLMFTTEVDERMKLSLGVENVTDRMPPFLEGNYYNGFDNLTFSSRGRFFYARAEMNF